MVIIQLAIFAGGEQLTDVLKRVTGMYMYLHVLTLKHETIFVMTVFVLNI